MTSPRPRTTRSGAGRATRSRSGLTEARGRYVAFVDADGDIGPEAIRPFLTIMKLYEPDIVLGSKRHPLSEVYYPPLRRLMSWTYHKLTRLLFRVNVRDTQTGLKLVRRDVLAAVLPRLFEKRYAFDLELLVVARSLGYTRVFEAPVRIDYKFASQVDPARCFRIGLDTVAIFYRHYVLGSYRRETEARSRVLNRRDDTRCPRRSDGAANGAAARGETAGSGFCSSTGATSRTRMRAARRSLTHEVAKRWVEQGHDVSLLTSGFAAARSTRATRRRPHSPRRPASKRLVPPSRAARARHGFDGFDVVIDEINTARRSRRCGDGGCRRPSPSSISSPTTCWMPSFPGRWRRSVAGSSRALLRLYRDLPTVADLRLDERRSSAARLRDVSRSFRPDATSRRPLGASKEHEPTLPLRRPPGREQAAGPCGRGVPAHSRARLPDARLWIVGHGPTRTTSSRQPCPKARSCSASCRARSSSSAWRGRTACSSRPFARAGGWS